MQYQNWSDRYILRYTIQRLDDVFFHLCGREQVGVSIVSTVTFQIYVDLDGDLVLTENREGEGALVLLEHGHPFLVGPEHDPLELL